jgi:deoxyribose-phosphate aldolase
MSSPRFEDLVQEITQEVLRVLHAQTSQAFLGKLASKEILRKGKGIVLVFLPCNPSPEGLQALSALLEKSEKLYVAVSPIVKEDLSLRPVLEKAIPIFSLEEIQNQKLFSCSSFLFVPSFSMQALSALVLGASQTFPLNVIILALQQGLPVYTIREGLSAEPGAEEFLKDLQRRGLKVLNLQDVKGMGSCAVSPCQALSDECNACGHCVVKLEDRVDRMVRYGASRIGGTLGMPAVRQDLASYIDHTLLKPDATREDVLKLCGEALEYGFASVCVNPSWVALCAEALRGSSVKVCTVVGFPLGATTTIAKVMETRDAIANGADEIDMVINVGALKARQDDLVLQDIKEVRQACQGKVLKVILETALLSDEEKVRACLLAKEAGADFVKTSTGFGPGGATVHDVALMRQTVGEDMGVKASGGIRDYETAVKMVEAGATRIGASASVAIMEKIPAGSGKY